MNPPKQNDFALSTKLVQIFQNTWIFSPLASKHVAQKMKPMESKYSTPKVLKSNEATF
jgi:hypothetical protein